MLRRSFDDGMNTAELYSVPYRSRINSAVRYDDGVSRSGVTATLAYDNSIRHCRFADCLPVPNAYASIVARAGGECSVRTDPSAARTVRRDS